MPADWPDGKAPEDETAKPHDVPLTDDPAPYLVLGGWRNPLMPDSVSASLSGQIIAAAAEGYPKFFEKLGVKPAAKGGDVTKPGALEGEFDENRTREIRAMDVVLSKARIGTRLQIDVHDPLLDAQTESISTVFLNDYAARHRRPGQAASGGEVCAAAGAEPRAHVWDAAQRGRHAIR